MARVEPRLVGRTRAETTPAAGTPVKRGARRAARAALTRTARRSSSSVPLEDDAALQLEGRGQLAGLDGELAREKSDLLDRLVSSEPLVDLLDLLLHVGLEDGAPRGVLGGARGAPGLLGLRRDAERVEGQKRHHVRPPVADRHRLRDRRDLLELALEVLRRDVLAARGDEQLLLAVGHAQEAVRVDLAHVAGVDPPFARRASPASPRRSCSTP